MSTHPTKLQTAAAAALRAWDNHEFHNADQREVVLAHKALPDALPKDRVARVDRITAGHGHGHVDEEEN